MSEGIRRPASMCSRILIVTSQSRARTEAQSQGCYAFFTVTIFVAQRRRCPAPCIHAVRDSSISHSINHLPFRPPAPAAPPRYRCSRESPSHPPGAKDHVSGILDPFAERNSGEVVAENWNSVPLGRRSLLDRRTCELSAQRLVSVVRHSQQASRVNAAIEGPRRKRSSEKKDKTKWKRRGAFLGSLAPAQW